jgi:hypothetical protein
MKDKLEEFLFSLFFNVILSITYGIQTAQSCKAAMMLLAIILLYVYIFFVAMKHFSVTMKNYIRLPELLLSKFIAQGSCFFLLGIFFNISHDKYDYFILIMFFITSAFLIESCNNSIKKIKE